MSWFRTTLVFAALLALAGCGWEPLYGQVHDTNGATVGGNAGPRLATVHVLPIADRTGQNLYNELRDRINPQGVPANPQYDLVIKLAEHTTQLLILQDQTASRTNLTLNATFTLYQRGSDKPVLQGNSRATTTYDLLNDEYATIQAQNDARRRGAQSLADDIATQLAVFLARPAGS
jgi:LPS-assembly lipoprotein